MRPYKAVININFQIFPVDVTGEASGQTLSRHELKSANIIPFTISVKGSTKEECIEALRSKLESFK